MLSSESSASSGGSSGASKTSSGLGIDVHTKVRNNPKNFSFFFLTQRNESDFVFFFSGFQQNETANRAKAEKIKIALEKMKLASVKKLFIKAFTSDGSTKSLLIDEKMTCGYVTRLLADKNHVTMEPKWAIVEHLPELYMERVYEDHELLVDNLMMWTRDSKNKIIFNERPDKYQLFSNPETYLLSSTDILCDYDDHSRAMLLEEFFSATSNTVPEISGPLYLKSESKKGWKKFHFVLRASGLYYYPKEKSKSSKDLVCLTSFDINEVYFGVGWKKKFKSPTDYCFAIKHPRLQQPKSTKYIKYLCADDSITLQKWIVGIRIAKHGRQLLENYRSLLDDLAQEDLDLLAHARSCSVASIAQTNLTEIQERTLTRRDSVNSRGGESRASSSSSSGCLSDGASCVEQGFESGTIKRKPSVNPKLPLTSMTRQLKEVGETVVVDTVIDNENGGTLTRGRTGSETEEGKLSKTGTLTRNSLKEAMNTLLNQTESISRDESSSKIQNNDFDVDLLPPPSEMFESTLSLSSLPPPPSQSELPVFDESELTCSSLSLASLPPFPTSSTTTTTPRVSSPKSDLSTPVSSGGATPVNAFSPDLTPTNRSPAFSPPSTLSPKVPPKPFHLLKNNNNVVNSIIPYHSQMSNSDSLRSPVKSTPPKKISFNFVPEEMTTTGTTAESPKKPLPPRRNENTSLTSPKKIASKESTLTPPPKEFLKDLQRVMRKKWQVAQKCKLDTSTTPHEVLGFRDPPPPVPDYKETNVSNWVQEHYGKTDNLYENVYLVGSKGMPGSGGNGVVVGGGGFENSIAMAIANKKRPPPPPPKRSETTQLTTTTTTARFH
ncbi:conserved hypothetical protein [Pediculus humanus corporis]|uniref:Uncharacterized protein n=1 Tax=Pediculus humanus subsp. corporis TaxID=121224 RepID=E0VRD6_PEDHC|nr:uncharacterized protein Phum_PHUM397090 [Pediculus humanus corporis]EEB15942.1 conserved hypothetical protein [Pediculus humanus corporis]